MFSDAPTNQEYAAFSPDGRWIAYKSDESGREEVYVRAFPGPGSKWLVSSGGGTYPMWSKGSRELLYIGADGRVQVADYTAKGEAFVADKPRPWAAGRFAFKASLVDLMPDGKRILAALPLAAESDQQGSQWTVLLNFFDELRRKAPGN